MPWRSKYKNCRFGTECLKQLVGIIICMHLGGVSVCGPLYTCVNIFKRMMVCAIIIRLESLSFPHFCHWQVVYLNCGFCIYTSTNSGFMFALFHFLLFLSFVRLLARSCNGAAKCRPPTTRHSIRFDATAFVLPKSGRVWLFNSLSGGTWSAEIIVCKQSLNAMQTIKRNKK